MKILVVPRFFVERELIKNPEWHFGKNVISIFSNNDVSPLPDRFNVLKLEFDDVSERDMGGWAEGITWTDNRDNLIFFNQRHASMIKEFINNIKPDTDKTLFIHCDAGVSRSGAVGMVLNEYFNKYLVDNKKDYDQFTKNNPHILPNPLVTRILKEELFGPVVAGIKVNDYEYNEDGEKIDHITEI